MTTSAAAQTCNGGTMVTTGTDSRCTASTCNSVSLCRSNRQMNWWTAVLRCRANGRELVSIETACPNNEEIGNPFTCYNLCGAVSPAWINKVSDGRSYVNGHGGRCDTFLKTEGRNANRYALCE